MNDIKTQKEFMKLKKNFMNNDKSTLVLKVTNFQYNVCGGEDCVYDKKTLKKIEKLVNTVGKEIWLDKSFVDYKGSRWKNAFINEEAWYSLCKIIVGSNMGRLKYNNLKAEECSYIIQEALVSIVTEYLASIIKAFDYECEGLTIEVKEKCKFYIEYEFDDRKEWNF